MTKLKDKLSSRIKKEEIPSSYDIVGNIAIFSKLPTNVKKQKLVGNTIITKNKHILTVLLKTSIFSGRFRLAKYKFVAGEKTKETLYKENNCIFKLDVEKCYFSPRLSNERMRIAKQVKKNEKILVMFSGVGVYPIVIAKNSNAKEILGIEMNKIAYNYAEYNLKLNKIQNVRLICGDVKKEIPKLKVKFDRVLMPLPKGANKYLDMVKICLKKKGILHYYDFLREEELPQKGLEKLNLAFPGFKLLNYNKCGNIAPGKFRVCFDIQVK
ncbi:class I SAM-dependent methyltransferase family protein [Candidatus Woesearchaeota archaeon]|nr:class I SAM-dependent methyltransferase family protein [Candidatus Woesearchaeota archaeon]